MGDFNGCVVSVLEGVPGRDGARNVRYLNTDGGVVTPFDADRILHYGSPLQLAGGWYNPARLLMLVTVPSGKSFFGWAPEWCTGCSDA
jgi:hypothetical protein